MCYWTKMQPGCTWTHEGEGKKKFECPVVKSCICVCPKCLWRAFRVFCLRHIDTVCWQQKGNVLQTSDANQLLQDYPSYLMYTDGCVKCEYWKMVWTYDNWYDTSMVVSYTSFGIRFIWNNVHIQRSAINTCVCTDVFVTEMWIDNLSLFVSA